MTICRHYKGRYYNVLESRIGDYEAAFGDLLGKEFVFNAKHTEKETDIPVYLSKKSGEYGFRSYVVNQEHVQDEPLTLYEDIDGNYWIRPYQMFHSHVMVDGEQLPRFTVLSDEDVYEIIQEQYQHVDLNGVNNTNGINEDE